MTRFKVPAREQQIALMVGILIALVLRGIFILLGAAVLERFSWVFFIFGAFLIYTAVKLILDRNEQDDYEDNLVIRRLRKVLPVQPGLRRRQAPHHGRRQEALHPAADRVPGDRQHRPALRPRLDPGDLRPHADPFIVFTANIFALMGLRQLYFLLGGLLDRLVYLSIGLAVVLGGIGIKLVLEALHTNELPFLNGGERVSWAPEMPTWVSLVFIVVVLAVTTVASLLRSRQLERRADEAPPA